MRHKISKDHANLAINISLALLALISAIFAFNANRKSDKANQLAEEANLIAKKSNELTTTSLNPDIRVLADSEELIAHRSICEYSSTNRYPDTYMSYMSYFEINLGVIVSNTGGANTSLISVETFDLNYEWKVISYTQNQLLSLPTDIPAGSSKSYLLSARQLVSTSSSRHMLETYDIALGKEFLDWKLTFGNGEIINLKTQVIDKGLSSFSLRGECDFYFWQ